jgi:hypothetical protein
MNNKNNNNINNDGMFGDKSVFGLNVGGDSTLYRDMDSNSKLLMSVIMGDDIKFVGSKKLTSNVKNNELLKYLKMGSHLSLSEQKEYYNY